MIHNRERTFEQAALNHYSISLFTHWFFWLFIMFNVALYLTSQLLHSFVNSVNKYIILSSIFHVMMPLCGFLNIMLSDVDECQENPCRNHGTCANFVGGYNCSCVDGWKGKHCEQGLMLWCLNCCMCVVYTVEV